MSKLLFDQIDRQIIREGGSLYASRMRLFVAIKRLEKAILRSIFKPKHT